MPRYDNTTKKKILAYLETHSYLETQQKFKVSAPTLAKWIKEKGIVKKKGRPSSIKITLKNSLTDVEKEFLDRKMCINTTTNDEYKIYRRIRKKLDL